MVSAVFSPGAVVTESPIRSSLTSRAASLVTANALFVLVGVLRMKFVAISLGVTAIGSYGQASLLQALVIAAATAGAVTAGRVGISSGRYLPTERMDAAARMFRRPFFGALAMTPVLVLASPLISSIYSGSSAHTEVFVAAALGLVPLTLAQSSLALVQVRGTPQELFLGSFLYLMSGGIVIAISVLPGNEFWAATSLTTTPLLQVLSLTAASPVLRDALRQAVFTRPRGRSPLGQVARASLVISLVTLGVDTVLRALLVSAFGIDEVALLQPAQLLAVQGFSLISVSISQVVMVDQNQKSAGHESEFVQGPWNKALIVSGGVAAVALVVCVLGPHLVPLFFSQDFAAAVPLLTIALAAEPLRALAWISGSTLFPQQRACAWIVIQVLGIVSLVATSALLASRLGVACLLVGSVVSTMAVSVATWAALRPVFTPRELLSLAWLVGFTGTLLAFGLTDQRYLIWAAGAMCCGLTATTGGRPVFRYLSSLSRS